MAEMTNAELLKNPKVRQEIDKHKWIESEKAGRDIGFNKAAEDWIKRYGKQWASKQAGSSAPKITVKW